MIEANLLFVLMIIFVIIIAQSTIYRQYRRENFHGCNPTNGCAPCGYPCKLGCPENIIEGYSSFGDEECSPMALQYPNGNGCYGNTKNFPDSSMIEYDNTYPKCNGGELREGFDTNNTYSADYLNNFQIQIKQSCSPDEVDMGDTCVKTGCSLGFERGVGDTSGTCFPQCLPGYETMDGNSGRCYKKCELGYETQGTKCFRPEHIFKKHTLPYSGLTQEVVVTPPHQHVKTINLVKDRNVVDKIPLEVAVAVDPTIPIPTAVPDIQLGYGYGGRYGGGYYGGYGGYLNNTYYYPNNGQSYLPVRRFGNSWLNYGRNVNDINVIEGFDAETAMPPKIPHHSPVQMQPPSPIQTPPPMKIKPTPKDSEVKSVATTASAPLRETLPNRDLFMPGDGEGCPYGYSVSGDTCYENCPPNYKDIDGVSCARESYVVDRQSYDRGAGVPYRQVRNKYARIFPGN